MAFVYDLALATAGNTNTNGAANTESSVFTLATAAALPANAVGLFAVGVQGKGTAGTTITGLSFRIIKLTTASATTGGTPVTPRPTNIGTPAATGVCFSTVTTIGATGRTAGPIFGCGASGPGGWVAANPDAIQWLHPTATAGSIDLVSATGGTTLPFEWWGQHQE